MGTPFTPANIHQGADGRWYHDGDDVTDWPVWWHCRTAGHSWRASLAARLDPADLGCPDCYLTAHPLAATG